MKVMPWFVVICLVTLFGHYHLYCQNRITGLEQHVKLSEDMASIERDSVNDLMHANQQLSSELHSEKTQSYVAGAVAAIQDTDNVEQIWHAGYDRGSEVQVLAQEAQKSQEDQVSTTDTALNF